MRMRIEHAAKVIATLHRGEKRLAFADSKRSVEMVGAEMRTRDVTTHLVHGSHAVQACVVGAWLGYQPSDRYCKGHG